MPGGIDPHTHMELMFMGKVSADDFEWGTKAGLSGGTTMIVDFCIPAPGESMLAAYQAWRHKAEKACSDYSFHMAVTQWSPQIHDEMETVVKTYGINTFKHFMAYKGALMVNDDELYNSFRRCAQLGALPLVHAENGDVVARMQADLLARGVTGPEGHSYSRPPEVEGEAANRAIMIADMAGCPLYIVHVSCEQTHDAIRRAKQAGQRVFGEPLVQYLVLDDSEYQNKDWDYAAGRVMSPPFRNRKHQDSLWAGLQSGTLSVVATDHCSFTVAQKRNGVGDFTKIPNGTGGLEDRLPVLWNAGVEHRPPHQGGVRRRDVDQHRAHPQHVSEEGCGDGGLGCRPRDLGPQGHQDHHREEPGVAHRVQRVRGLYLHRRAAHRVLARPDCLARGRHARQARRRRVRPPRTQCAGQRGQRHLEGADATQARGSPRYRAVTA